MSRKVNSRYGEILTCQLDSKGIFNNLIKKLRNLGKSSGGDRVSKPNAVMHSSNVRDKLQKNSKTMVQMKFNLKKSFMEVFSKLKKIEYYAPNRFINLAFKI